MTHIKLPERLKAIAGCIHEGAAVADIGTDHGFLPVYLAQIRRTRRIIASDSSAGSLGTAQKNAAARCVSDKIEFALADGLEHIGRTDVDTVVIAGVGGETILGILERAPWTLEAHAAGELRLILQPQTKLDVLHDFLHYKGYTVAEELTVTDRGREYTIIVI